MDNDDSLAPASAPTGSGSITVVDARPTSASGSKKRPRSDTSLPVADAGAPPSNRPAPSSANTVYVNEEEAYGDEYYSDEEEEEKPRSEVQRLLDARHRRRRLGKHMANDQFEEDMEEVKKFLALSHADREAYLTIYEYDGSTDNLVEGLAKASSLALRVGLAYTVPPRDYDLASMALEMPEVKDSLATVWDCVDIGQYGGVKAIKTIAAVGHVGDTLLGAAMRLYQGVAKAAELRNRSQHMERRRLAGDQSVFDFASKANDAKSTPSGDNVPAQQAQQSNNGQTNGSSSGSKPVLETI